MIRSMTLFFVFAVGSLFANGTNPWYEDVNQALVASQMEGKNVFVLVTSPSWCGRCQKFEEEILNDYDFKEYLNENFIRCKILDTNDQNENFNFSGYPMILIVDNQGNILSDSIYSDSGIDVSAYISNMRIYENITATPEIYVLGRDHIFINNGNGTWRDNFKETYHYFESSDLYHFSIVNEAKDTYYSFDLIENKSYAQDLSSGEDSYDYGTISLSYL